MSIWTIVFIFGIIIIIGIIKKKYINTPDDNHYRDLTDTVSIDHENVDFTDYKELYFNEIKNGNKPYKIMNIYNQFDLMLIKSLLQSEKVPYYIENEHTSRLRPGMQLGSFKNTIVNILERDYEKTVNLIHEYKKNKKIDNIEKPTIRKPLEVLFGNWTVPEAQTRDGVEIFYRDSKK